MPMSGAYPVSVMNQFPDFKTPGFDIHKYNSQFLDSNFIIHARSKNISFNKHWGCLSAKFAWQGDEFYECNGGLYAVNESSFLVLNEGTYYSSHIDSPTEVESFTINFAPGFEQQACQAVVHTPEYLMDNYSNFVEDEKIYFTEKLFQPDPAVLGIVERLKLLSASLTANHDVILHQYYLLYRQLCLNEKETQKSISQVDAVRSSTKKELYTRLTRSRDFILSNFKKNLTLREIAGVSCLNQYYFLRQFKRMFELTPHQFLQRLKMEEAAAMLKKTDFMVSEICNDVGFSDPASFSKLFKRHFSRSPQEFRKDL